ncbi:hypothetical protein [Tunicatimonas pelagia]|uniref:hypothetical protein n=1 Tax=Tunicatimonas pelagia TaxID=931531 RepID=UPI002666097D|nr:hypothetical protein [Tunicatimonas pelagia]WKN40734.1 hypothetical protein P0M28_16980 [Tunicatimonas pelagia]
MEKTTLREELHQYIDQADERILKLIYGMMQADQPIEVPKFHQDIIQERLTKHQANPKDVLSWQQVRDHVQQRG